MTGAIALGLLQLISVKYENSIWKVFDGFLRTKSRNLPSERTVKSVIGNLLVRDLFSLAPGLIIRKIMKYRFKKKVLAPACQNTDSLPELETTDI